MRIYTKSGDLAFKTFTFPDGQPHFKLETLDDSGFVEVTIETAIKSSTELFLLVLVSDTLRNCGYTSIRLDIRYLLGARMDRAIDSQQPHTLLAVARVINSCGFSQVRILDVHSEVAIRLIRNSVNVLPFKVVEQVLTTLGKRLTVSPDKGALPRVRAFCGYPSIVCGKTREMATGKLTGFEILEGKDYLKTPVWEDAACLIIDDICDGGGTFVGLAKELRAAGAKKVFLYVTHGIFSKGPDALVGIDHIYTTDSLPQGDSKYGYVPVKPVTVIPISMKELA